jgi:hypothetical protein
MNAPALAPKKSYCVPLAESDVGLLLEGSARARILGFPDGNLAVAMSRLDTVGPVILALLRHLYDEVGQLQKNIGIDTCPEEQRGQAALRTDPRQLGLTLTVWANGQAEMILQPHPGEFHRLDPASGRHAMPHWDSKRRELHLGSVLIRRFKRRAPHQELILSAFEQAGWPRRINNPLPSASAWLYDEQLHDAIKRLNRHQMVPLLTFHGNGSGHGVRWELAC